MWEPFKEKRESIRDWDEHKREAMQKFAEYVKGRGRGIEADDSLDPLRIGSSELTSPDRENGPSCGSLQSIHSWKSSGA